MKPCFKRPKESPAVSDLLRTHCSPLCKVISVPACFVISGLAQMLGILTGNNNKTRPIYFTELLKHKVLKVGIWTGEYSRKKTPHD